MAAVVVPVNNQPKTQISVWDFENDWDHDICGFCENCSTLMCACCCWPIFICSLPHKLGESRTMLCCVPHPLLPMRTKVRSVLRIRGSLLEDCACSFFFPLCTAIQLSNELDHKGFR